MLENSEIPRGETGRVFVTLARNPDYSIVTGTVTSTLQFKAVAKDEDGEIENEYEDEFNYEEVSI